MQFKRSAKLLGAFFAALTLSVAAAPAQDNAPVTTQDNAPVTTQESAPVKASRSETMASTRTNLPAGTKVIVRLNSPLDSGTATQGQTWSGTTASDILIDNKVAVPAGSPVNGTVTDAKSSGRLHGNGLLSLQVSSVNGIPIATDTLTRDGAGHTKSNVAKIGGGAAAGAILGGLFGGGKGAAIGTVVGAGAGTAGAAATGKREANIPAETALTFTVQ
ncbi:MAG TPA: hypothetical protein VNX22_01730 [Acidobacteriaceae bacterium]|nr:hypothetical protein [Acidobacteriaceae bacterium]